MSDWETEYEKTDDGTPIIRHEARSRDLEITPGDEKLIEAISDHIEKYVGEPDGVYHELVSDMVHIDIHVVPPTDDCPFYTLVTSGMSEKPMYPQPGAEQCMYAELTLSLPPDWPGIPDFSGEPKVIDDDHPWSDEANYWPIRWMKMLARMPQEYETWIWFGHTIPNGDPPEPFASNTDLSCWMLAPTTRFGPGGDVLKYEDREITFLAMWPLHTIEMEYKLAHGFDALIEQIPDNFPVLEFLMPDRPPLFERREKRRWWWPFG